MAFVLDWYSFAIATVG